MEEIPVVDNFGDVKGKVVTKDGVNLVVISEVMSTFCVTDCADDGILLVIFVDLMIDEVNFPEVDWILIVVTNDSNISSKASIFSSIFSLVSNKEDFKEARDDNSVPVHESTEALVILDASNIISLTLDIWLAIESNSVTQSMKSEQSVDFNIFLDVMDSIVVVTSSIAFDISWRLLIFSNTSFLGKAVVGCCEENPANNLRLICANNW